MCGEHLSSLFSAGSRHCDEKHREQTHLLEQVAHIATCLLRVQRADKQTRELLREHDDDEASATKEYEADRRV